MKTKTFFKVLGMFIKSYFTCIHSPGDLTVVRLTDKVDDIPDDDFPCEAWNTRSLCKCGEMVDYEFAFSVSYKNANFNEDGTRIEDVQ